MVARYYFALRSVLRDKPHLRKCLVRCRHCRILFITHPRNAGRSDLGCPFGCRQAHRRKKAIERSREYYRSEEGKIKKKYLNATRSEQARSASPSRDENDDSGSDIDEAIVSHIHVVTSLIEGRDVGLAEIRTMLDKILRQHSIDMHDKLPYAGFSYQKAPP